MGLSASQARLLNLTARMHDIEYKAQNLEAQKLQMANESKHVYKEYEDALNKQKVQFKQIGADGSATYKDASLQTLLAAGYQIKILNGNTWYNFTGTTKDANGNLTNNAATDWNEYSTTITEFTATANTTKDRQPGEVVTVGAKKYMLAETLKKGATNAKGYEQITAGTAATTGNLIKIDLNSTETLRNLVEAGFIVFQKPTYASGVQSFSEVNIATDTSLQEISDETELKKAEAKYEADMRKIDAKDKKFDTDLAAMEAERNAIKTEMDTLKTVAKDNVDRTFKLFS